jgi:hypothetical protein
VAVESDSTALLVQVSLEKVPSEQLARGATSGEMIGRWKRTNAAGTADL